MKRQETNRGYEHDAPSRSGSNGNIEMQPLGVYVSSQQTQVQYGLAQYEVPYGEMQAYGHPGPQQYSDPRVQMQEFGRQGPQQYVHPSVQMHGYGHSGPQQYTDPRIQMQYVHPGPQMIPAPQYMARDSTTPMPADFVVDAHQKRPLIWVVIIKRIVSAIFIIFDSLFSWFHFLTLLSGESQVLEYFEFAENFAPSDSKWGKRKLGGKVKLFGALDCGDSTDTWIALKGTFTAISTLWACFQLINIVGETIIEYQLSRTRDHAEFVANIPDDQANGKPNTKSCFKGFQILHGWVEVVVSQLCGDVPQVIISLVLGVNCTIDIPTLILTCIWMFIKSLKNDIRKATCKHDYKPCCYECCCFDCCVYYYDCPCVCSVLIFRVCGIFGNEKVCECQKYEICPGGFCVRGGHCCSNIAKDPEWAKRTSTKLELLYYYISVAANVLPILAGLGILKL